MVARGREERGRGSSCLMCIELHLGMMRNSEER